LKAIQRLAQWRLAWIPVIALLPFIGLVLVVQDRSAPGGLIAPQHAANGDEWFELQRAYPTGRRPSVRTLDVALASVRPPGFRPRLSVPNERWTSIGPQPIYLSSSYTVAGRVTSLVTDPKAPSTVYAGSDGGGIWKSVNAGTTWTSLTDAIPVPAIQSIAIDPVDSKLLYATTIRRTYQSRLLRSTDAGVTWQVSSIVTDSGDALSNGPCTIVVSGCNPPSSGSVFLDPQRSGSANTSTVYFTGLSHLLRSDNSGGTFHPVLSLAADLDFGSPTAPGQNPQAEFIRDATLDPSRPGRLYVVVATPSCIDSACARATSRIGIYRSLDRGDHWERQDLSGTAPYATILGRSSNFEGLHVPRARIAISPANPNVLAIAFGDEQIARAHLVISTDGGDSWIERPLLPAGSFTWSLAVAFAPASAAQMYVGSGSVFFTSDSGLSWTDTRAQHGDQQAMSFNAARELVVANDGGVYRLNASGTWTSLNDTLSITETYSVASHPSKALVFAAGTQDNGTTQFAPGLGWRFALGADGGDVAFDLTPQTTRLYAESQWLMQDGVSGYRFARCDAGASCVDKTPGLNTSADGPFTVRMAVDRQHPATLWLTAEFLFRTDDAGDHWRAASPSIASAERCWLDPAAGRLCATAAYFTAAAVAPTASQTVYAGTLNGDVRLTTNGGDVWVSVAGTSAGPLPVRKVSDIVVDPLDANVAYVAYSGFDSGGSGRGHVFRTADRGQTWEDVTRNLPDIPVNALLIDPDSAAGSTSRVLYAGTDVGVFRITDNGAGSWEPFGTGLPPVVVTGLAYSPQTRQLFAATYGRGVWALSSRFAR
jgi:photosystem II stability/assembly factor-like uncharacterized protein